MQQYTLRTQAWSSGKSLMDIKKGSTVRGLRLWIAFTDIKVKLKNVTRPGPTLCSFRCERLVHILLRRGVFDRNVNENILIVKIAIDVDGRFRQFYERTNRSGLNKRRRIWFPMAESTCNSAITIWILLTDFISRSCDTPYSVCVTKNVEPCSFGGTQYSGCSSIKGFV